MHPILVRTCRLLLSGFMVGAVAAVSVGATEIRHPFTPLSLEAALSDAHGLAERHEGAQVVRVSGSSMLPFFGDGSVVVMRPITAERLRAGMIVVYRNRFGETVAHRAMVENEAGWEVRGYANEASDSTVVDAENLLGVVYATFYSNGRIRDEAAAASLLSGTVVALAAPAR